MSVAPPSFDGHGWLVVINLAIFTAGALVCAMAAGKMVLDLWRDKHSRGPLVVLLRTLMLAIFGGMTIRTGVEALSLWGWDPHNAGQTGSTCSSRPVHQAAARSPGRCALSSRGLCVPRDGRGARLGTGATALPHPPDRLLPEAAPSRHSGGHVAGRRHPRGVATMIARVAATGAVVTPVAAAALNKAKAATSEPVIWHFLGYSFEAAGMVAALFGCLAARYWVGAALATKQQHRWSLDVPVSATALATSAGLMISTRPAPLYALLVGAGVGSSAKASSSWPHVRHVRAARSARRLSRIESNKPHRSDVVRKAYRSSDRLCAGLIPLYHVG